ncbi:MAG: hypothetical protein ACQESP_12885 [Candidatus Muiribacteriota bacterium]
MNKGFELYNISALKEDDKAKIDKYISHSVNICNDYKDLYFKAIKKLISIEQYYVYNKYENYYCYYNLIYVIHLIHLAQKAISLLENVDKNNKKVAYFENTKYSSLDELISDFDEILAYKDHRKLNTKRAIKEIKLKRLITRMKKDKSLFFNFYLTTFSLYPIKYLNISKDEKEFFDLIQNVYSFFSIGHATSGQIRKSLAIQIYSIYKPYLKKTELQNTISDLITACFEMKTYYKNFHQIDETAYIKNLVNDFPVFSNNNDLANEQIKLSKQYFIHRKIFSIPILPLRVKRFFYNKIFTKPLEYYQKQGFMTFFGFVQKKI